MVRVSICSCGKVSILQREVCPSCHKKMSAKEVGNKGKLLTFTTLHSPPEGFKSPIHLAMVELENRAKVLCEARCEMKIGKEVILEEEEGKYFCRDLS